MKHPEGGLPSGISFREILLSYVLAGAVVTLPSLAAAQAPSELSPPTNTTTLAPPTDTSQQMQPADWPQQPQTGSEPVQSTHAFTPKDTPKELPQVPEQDKPKIKRSSEADVDAIGNRKVGRGVNFYSLEKEITLGKSLAQQVERSSNLLDDPVVSEYVNRVGQNLVRNSDAKVPFTIRVIDSDQINAVALPGGFFYVNSGLILATDSEAELSGVMAHEIAHVAARHGTKNATKGELAQLATFSLMLLGPGGMVGYGLSQALNIGVPLTFLKFSRDDERKADYLGLQYMYKAGYDPNALLGFFEKMEAQEKQRPGMFAKFFSAHPPTSDRVRNIQKEIGEILPTRDQYIVTTSEFDTAKARLQRIDTRLQNSKNAVDKPTLHTRTEQQKSDSGQQTSNTTDPNQPTLH